MLAYCGVNFFAGPFTHMAETRCEMKHQHSVLKTIALILGTVALTAASGCAAAPVATARVRTQHRLAKLVLVHFDKTPFNTAIGILAKDADVNVCLETNALADAGIRPATPVTVDFMRPVPIAVAMDAVLENIESPSAPLGWSLRHGVLLVTQRVLIPNSRVVHVYNIGDLVDSGVHSNNAAITLRQNSDNLVQVIENTVDRNSWIDNGGAVGAIRIFRNTLVVTTTPADQAAVAALLRKLAADQRSQGS
jgi:hypothetical protein